MTAYNKGEFDMRKYLFTLLFDPRLSDALVFLIVGKKIVVAINRHGKWPADSNSDGDIYTTVWTELRREIEAWSLHRIYLYIFY